MHYGTLGGMSLLCRQGGNGPYIRDGRYNRRHFGERSILSTDEYQLIFVDDGVVRYRHGVRQVAPSAPCALLVPPGIDFSIDLPKGVTWHHLRFLAICKSLESVLDPTLEPKFTPSSIRRTSKMQPSPQEVWGVVLPIEIPRALLDECRAMMRWCNAHWWRDAVNYARANYHLGLWLLDMVEAVGGTTLRKDDWLGRLGAYCKDNIIHGLTVAEVARHAGMSRQNLRRRLQESCGMTPKAYMDTIRFDIACQRLRATRDSINDISRYSGYASPSVFTRRFRKLAGVSPRQWRQQNRDV